MKQIIDLELSAFALHVVQRNFCGLYLVKSSGLNDIITNVDLSCQKDLSIIFSLKGDGTCFVHLVELLSMLPLKGFLS